MAKYKELYYRKMDNFNQILQTKQSSNKYFDKMIKYRNSPDYSKSFNKYSQIAKKKNIQ